MLTGALPLISWAAPDLCGAGCDQSKRVSWERIGTNTAATKGTSSFTDPEAANYSMRFYRSVVP